MRLVVLESPYAAPTPEGIERNVRYARACVADCFRRGEAAIVSHLLYTQPGILRDEVPEERALGIEAGLLWGEKAEATVVYTDVGTSRGVEAGIQRAKDSGRPIEYRSIGGEWSREGRRAIEIRAGGLPIEAVLDDLIREGLGTLYVIRVVMDAYGLSLSGARDRVEPRCHALKGET